METVSILCSLQDVKDPIFNCCFNWLRGTATAVAAVKIGAVDYLAKPADANDIVAALLSTKENKPPPPENPMSADRVKWEHIQRVLNYAIEMFQKLQED